MAEIISDSISIQALPAIEIMDPAARKLRDNYAIKPNAPFYQREFGFYSIDRWKKEGLPEDVSFDDYFGYDRPANHAIWGLGWCEAPFYPLFEEKILEDRGDYELIQDNCGRSVLCFKGRRSGFMPEYLAHPVKDQKTWEEQCAWRLDPFTPQRYVDLDKSIDHAINVAARGYMITQRIVGGYMYLRSLIGPADLLYKFCEDPELIHTCMRKWFTIADTVLSYVQKKVTLDELFLAEDICYNNGSLISPDMIKEFLFPYYQQLITNMRNRQIDKARPLFIQIDTDGKCESVMDLYKEIGMDAMSPFEVASGCDVVELGRKYPDLVMSGGVDKRILAESKDAIDRHINRIFPVMFKRGGYIPTCDHGVPEEVSLENYLHYRKRCREFAF